MKKRVNISLDVDTIEALKQLAAQRHTNVSQVVTQIVWKEMIPADDFMNVPE